MAASDDSPGAWGILNHVAIWPTVPAQQFHQRAQSVATNLAMELECDLAFAKADEFSVEIVKAAKSEKPTAKNNEMKLIQDEEDSGSNAAVFAALWRRRRKTWESTYLVGSCLPKDISFPSAAAAKLAKQPWVLGTTTGCGCLPCSKAGLSSDWARGTAGLVKGFRAWFLHKHQESHNHVNTVKQMLCIGDGGGAGEAMALSEFEALLKNLRADARNEETQCH